VPFVLFLLERRDLRGRRPAAAWALDGAVVGVALARSRWPLPVVSGHALFLSYALVSTRDPLVRWTAALVLGEVLYLKSFVWNDATGIGGLAVGTVAGLVERRLAARPTSPVS
jgi:hypothetical protein